MRKHDVLAKLQMVKDYAGNDWVKFFDTFLQEHGMQIQELEVYRGEEMNSPIQEDPIKELHQMMNKMLDEVNEIKIKVNKIDSYEEEKTSANKEKKPIKVKAKLSRL